MANFPRTDIKNFSRVELTEIFGKLGVLKFHAKQIFEWLYRKRVEDFSKMTNIPKKLAAHLAGSYYFSSLKMLKREKSKDSTEKFLFGMAGGGAIETVLIPEKKRMTLCVSSQAGCRFGCAFCASGLNGFERNLRPSEIVNQYLAVSEIAKEKITNVVFMGVGEPLDNFDNVVKAVDIMRDESGINLGKRKIVISTCGISPAISRLAALGKGLRLSVSLHSADDGKRSRLMKVNRRYNTASLIKVLKEYTSKEGFPVTFEYILIKGFNVSEEDALKLGMFVRGVPYKLNLIPYNYNPFFEWKTPSKREIESFAGVLRSRKIFYTLRRPRGNDISAACGMLRLRRSGGGVS